MKLVKNIKAGVRVLIVLNLMMAFTCIWFFMQMSPALGKILLRNGNSIQYVEEMIVILASADGTVEQQNHFKMCLDRARENISEDNEAETIVIIKQNYVQGLSGNKISFEKTLSACVELGRINRDAMVGMDNLIYNFCFKGAWIVVFMALLIFGVGVYFKHLLEHLLVKPWEELDNVLTAQLNGDRARRCKGGNVSNEVQKVYNNINDFIDHFYNRNQN